MSAYEYRIRGNYNLQSGDGDIPFRDSGISLSESILKHILHTYIQLTNITIYMSVVIVVCANVCMYVCKY